MPESVYASKAELNHRYVTKSGIPVTVCSMDNVAYGKPCIIVRNDISGIKTAVFGDHLLWPYKESLIKKEAIDMAKALKSGDKKEKNGTRGGERGARKDGDTIVLFREWKGKKHEAVYDGGVLKHAGKKFDSLSDVLKEIKGKDEKGTGKSFFGLRTPPNVGLGNEVVDGLKKSADEAKKKSAAARKAKAIREAEDDDDDNKAGRTVGDVVAKVMGKGRK
jgi:hypothetical protein